MVNIFGKMAAYTKVISSKVSGMAMEFGKINMSNIKDIIDQTKRKDLECIYGRIDRFTKDNSEMISDKVMGSFM